MYTIHEMAEEWRSVSIELAVGGQGCVAALRFGCDMSRSWYTVASWRGTAALVCRPTRGFSTCLPPAFPNQHRKSFTRKATGCHGREHSTTHWIIALVTNLRPCSTRTLTYLFPRSILVSGQGRTGNSQRTGCLRCLRSSQGERPSYKQWEKATSP